MLGVGKQKSWKGKSIAPREIQLISVTNFSALGFVEILRRVMGVSSGLDNSLYIRFAIFIQIWGNITIMQLWKCYEISHWKVDNVPLFQAKNSIRKNDIIHIDIGEVPSREFGKVTWKTISPECPEPKSNGYLLRWKL